MMVNKKLEKVQMILEYLIQVMKYIILYRK